MAKDKKTKKDQQSCQKQTVIGTIKSSATLKPVWQFDAIDRNGPFAFDVNRDDFNSKEVISKLIAYSTMTWSEIGKQTHDNGKSKNHYLNEDGLSKQARDRILAMGLQESTDKIYSLALQNKLRIIGLRDCEKFSVLWYDPKHEVYISTKK